MGTAQSAADGSRIALGTKRGMVEVFDGQTGANIASHEVFSSGESVKALVYRKNLYEMRDDILDKHKLRLSELDCIVEEGDEKSWPQS